MAADESGAAPPQSTVPPGTRILGDTYEVEALIKTGGMGEIYRGRNVSNNEPVAIKIVLGSQSGDDKHAKLFEREALVLSKLSHEAIVRYQVYTVDKGIGRPCLVMEFVSGPSLLERMADGPMPVTDIITVMRRIASGLEVAHKRGVIHRDLSPDNIILEEGLVENAKLIDFGIAKGGTIGGGTMLEGQVAGKFNYMPPEQLGMWNSQIDARSDIYSLGLVVAGLAQGKPVDMGATTYDAVMKRQSVPDLSMLDAMLRPVVAQMLAVDPAERPASMAAVIKLLDAAEANPPPSPPAAAKPESQKTVLGGPLPVLPPMPTPAPPPVAAPIVPPFTPPPVATPVAPPTAAVLTPGLTPPRESTVIAPAPVAPPAREPTIVGPVPPVPPTPRDATVIGQPSLPTVGRGATVIAPQPATLTPPSSAALLGIGQPGTVRSLLDDPSEPPPAAAPAKPAPKPAPAPAEKSAKGGPSGVVIAGVVGVVVAAGVGAFVFMGKDAPAPSETAPAVTASPAPQATDTAAAQAARLEENRLREEAAAKAEADRKAQAEAAAAAEAARKAAAEAEAEAEATRKAQAAAEAAAKAEADRLAAEAEAARKAQAEAEAAAAAKAEADRKAQAAAEAAAKAEADRLAAEAEAARKAKAEADAATAAWSEQTAWLRQASTGRCLHVELTSPPGAKLDTRSLAAASTNWANLREAFSSAFTGQRLPNTVITVPTAQCAALEFATALSQPAQHSADQPADQRATQRPLTLDSIRLSGGAPLQGRIALNGKDTVALFLIGATGAVTRLDSYAQPAGSGTVQFDVPLSLAPGSAPQNQLVMAILTDRPVTGFASLPDGYTADSVIPRLAQWLEQSGQVPVIDLVPVRLEP